VALVGMYASAPAQMLRRLVFDYLIKA